MSPVLEEMCKKPFRGGWVILLFLVYSRVQSDFPPNWEIWCTCLFLSKAEQSISFASTMKRALKLDNGIEPELCCSPAARAQQQAHRPVTPESHIWTTFLSIRRVPCTPVAEFSNRSDMCHSRPSPLKPSKYSSPCSLPICHLWRVDSKNPEEDGSKNQGTLNGRMQQNSMSLIPTIPINLHGAGCEQERNFKITDLLGCLWQLLLYTDKHTMWQWQSHRTSLNSASSSVNWD